MDGRSGRPVAPARVGPDDPDLAVTLLAQRGGLGRRGDLPRRALEAALKRERIVRLRRDRYALPEVAAATALAHEFTGALSHTSAALAWGWPIARSPERPHVAVPGGRHLSSRDRARADFHQARLTRAEVQHGRTGRLRTVIDCARVLPFPEALTVADSALREGRVTRSELLAAADRARGPGSAAIRTVATAADGRAANPFESVARSVCREVVGLKVIPQVQISDHGRFWARVDLADLDLGLVIECDGYEHHGGRSAFRNDRARYTALGMLGWTVFTYVWEDVFLTPEATRSALESWVTWRRTPQADVVARPWRDSVVSWTDPWAA